MYYCFTTLLIYLCTLYWYQYSAYFTNFRNFSKEEILKEITIKLTKLTYNDYYYYNNINTNLIRKVFKGSFASQTCHVEQVYGKSIDSVEIVTEQSAQMLLPPCLISKNTLSNIEYPPYGLPNVLTNFLNYSYVIVWSSTH